MDPRQSISRTASSTLQQSPYNNPNMSAYAGTMPQYAGGTHLPPISSGYPPPSHLPAANQSNMYQPPYRDNIPRYSQNPSPAATPDNRYGQQMAPQPMGNMPQNSMLPQPQGQAPQSQQPYTTQPGARPSSYPQPLAPAPPRSSMDPYGNYGQPAGDRPWTGAEQMPGMTTDIGRDPIRTHVVGSQGRRGILPSAPGRPPVMQNGLNGSPKGNTIPQKDADGKFPCPNCTKTYLHAKHLKRHMLRHTGDRPYMCVLCTDTFSRSDILKRHFQKCSVRRGNPTGASHLSNPAAHLKKSQAAAQKAAAAAANAHRNNSPQTANTPTSSSAVQPSPYTTTSMAGSSMPATTASLPAMASMPFANGQNDMKPAPGQQMQGSQAQAGIDQNSNTNWGLHNARNNQLMYNSNNASPAQGGHHVENDWNSFLPPTSDNNYMGQMYGYEQAHPEVKNEAHEGGSNGYYMPSTSLGADGTLGPPQWHFNPTHENSLHSKVERLIDFCFPQASLQEQQNNDHLRSCLTVDNVKHSIELFQHYHGHFPWLHLPTFDLFNSYDGLLLTIICSGAVYSDKISQSQVRGLVSLAKAGIQRTSQLLRHYSTDDIISPSDFELEELQALFLVQQLLTWHGNSEERAQARTDSRRLLQFIRQCQLLTLAHQGQAAYSYLHNLRPGQTPDASQWNWSTWLHQEKRLRLTFMALLSDTAWTLYFNCEPEFQASEIRLPLPCDDTAWDAPDAHQCASALGLYGHEYQAQFNTTGSLKSRQLNVDYIYRALHESDIPLGPRDTNVYGKFILIHLMHMDIWQLQKQKSLISPSTSPYAGTEAVNAHTKQRTIAQALDRWKVSWDTDLQIQYPSIPGVMLPLKRIGFCRDSVHFFWLAKAFLQPNRMQDWKLPADVKFRLLMHSLQKARVWSLSDGARRGEEPGSVAEIDPTYDNGEGEFDMRKLFRPITEVVV